MGLIKAGLGAVGGTLADQWKEFFYCDALSGSVLVAKGQKRTGSRSSNTRGNDNIISNGSGIAVADGQAMIIVEQGAIVDFCAEPGEYTYDRSSEPSLFTGSLSDSIKETFKVIGRRFSFGGDTGKDQRVYYFNTKEIIDNKFGTATPIMFRVVNTRAHMDRTVNVRCNGVYSYKITDPLLFYKELCGNVTDAYTKEDVDGQLKADFLSALQPAFAKLSSLELRPSDIPAHATELEDAMGTALHERWTVRRGITLCTVSLNPITLTAEDMQKIQQMEDAASYGEAPNMMAGRLGEATASAMEAAASNPSGAMTGFMGMGMAMNNSVGNVQGLYQMGAQQQSGDNWTCTCGVKNTGKFCTECGRKKPTNNNWICSCGVMNTGKFCTECGAKKPDGSSVRCSKCGWEPDTLGSTPKFCPECGSTFEA